MLGRGKAERLNWHPVMNVCIWAAVFVSVAPLVVLLLQCFLNRWSGLVPTEWTLRGMTTFARNLPKIATLTETTLIIGALVALLSTLVGMLLAHYFSTCPLKHPLLWDLAIMLPVFVPATVFGLGMRNAFFTLGIANSLPAVIIALCVVNVPYTAKMMIDVAQAVGPSLQEEARVLGASPLRSYLVGMLPSLLPGVFAAMGISFMNAINNYFLIILMGAGSVRTLISSLVLPAVQSAPMPVAATYCVFFIILDAGVFLLFQLLSRWAARYAGKNMAA